MADALEDHGDTVSIRGRTITNLSFADDIDCLAGEEEELANLVEPVLLPLLLSHQCHKQSGGR